MPSPFPGMDPYLEDPELWGGLHQRLITNGCNLLQPLLLPRGYSADIGERVLVVAGEPTRLIGPDVTVTRSPLRPARGTAAQILEADVPVEVEALTLEERQVFVEIRAASGELVTVVEILSPTNKQTTDGREEYRKKQKEILSSPVHLVEIDLLRTGSPILAVPAAVLSRHPALRAAPYRVCVHRGHRPGIFEIYPISLRDRLPRVRIPLRSEETDVALDLQAVFDVSYATGPYPLRIDYRAGPAVALPPEDAAWAEELLRRAGRR